MNQIDFSNNQQFIITPQKNKKNSSSWIIQTYSPPTSPQLHNNQSYFNQQISNKKSQEFNSETQEKQMNTFILGDINSFQQFNQIHYNIFQLKTSTLLNLKCQENSPQLSLNSNASTTNVTPYKEQEEGGWNQDNLTFPNQIENKDTPITQIIDENNKFNQNSNFTKIHIDTECNCQTTQCIKKYCSCFANNNFCVPSICKCKSCKNITQFSSTSSPKKQNIPLIQQESKIFCTCSKSFCKKQYCECFKQGKKCSNLCKCSNCYNHEKPINQKLEFDTQYTELQIE